MAPPLNPHDTGVGAEADGWQAWNPALRWDEFETMPLHRMLNKLGLSGLGVYLD